MTRKEPHAVSFEQARSLLSRLPDLVCTMVLLAVLTSMNIAEICGL